MERSSGGHEGGGDRLATEQQELAGDEFNEVDEEGVGRNYMAADETTEQSEVDGDEVNQVDSAGFAVYDRSSFFLS